MLAFCIAGAASQSEPLVPARATSMPSWTAAGLVLNWIETGLGPARLEARLDSLQLPGLPQPFSNLRLICDQAALTPMALSCVSGLLQFTHPTLGSPTAQVTLSYPHDGAYRFAFSSLALGQGTLAGELQAEADHSWTLKLQAKTVELSRVLDLLGGKQALAGYSADGRFDLDLAVQGDDTGLTGTDLQLAFRPLSFSNPQSTQVAEKLQESLKLRATRDGDAWSFTTDLGLAGGQLYLDPVFIDAGAAPVRVSLAGRYDAARQHLALSRCAYRQKGILSLSCGGRFHLAQPAATAAESLSVSVEPADFDKVYDTYLKPFLIGGSADELKVHGRVAGKVAVEGGALRETQLSLSQVDVEDQRGRYSVHGLDLQVGWRTGQPPQHSALQFRDAKLYQVPLGSTRLAFLASAQGLMLDGPARIPILDGGLDISRLTLTPGASGKPDIVFSGKLQPIDLPKLSELMGWPKLKGALSGSIPEAHYANGDLSVGGQLVLRAFDGKLTIDHLQMKDPLGTAPELRADIGIDRLDLGDITSAFSFGSITGRLSGWVKGLQLIDWQPSRFDLRLATPDDDDSRHRISQKAIDNLTRVGNGVSGVLSNSFLRFFKEFSYDRLGLTCILEGALCEMGGVAPHQGGYYIVKGAGLPRVDVIGYTHKVAWLDLIHRIEATDFSASPTVN